MRLKVILAVFLLTVTGCTSKEKLNTDSLVAISNTTDTLERTINNFHEDKTIGFKTSKSVVNSTETLLEVQSLLLSSLEDEDLSQKNNIILTGLKDRLSKIDNLLQTKKSELGYE